MAFKMNKPSMIKGTISHKTAINRSLDKPPASSAFQKVEPEDDVITREEKYYKQEGLPGFEYEGEWTPDPNDPYSMIRKGTKTTEVSSSSKSSGKKASKKDWAAFLETKEGKEYLKRKAEEKQSVTEEDVLRKPISQDIETIMPTLEQELGRPPVEVPLIQPKRKSTGGGGKGNRKKSKKEKKGTGISNIAGKAVDFVTSCVGDVCELVPKKVNPFTGKRKGYSKVRKKSKKRSRSRGALSGRG